MRMECFGEIKVLWDSDDTFLIAVSLTVVRVGIIAFLCEVLWCLE